MKLKINKDVELYLFSLSYAADFYESIHKSNAINDVYRGRLKEKYNTLDKVKSRIIDAIDNKYKVDGSPDFFIFYKNELAGIFEFHPLQENENYLEVGYWLYPEFRRMGILFDIFPEMFKYCKDNFSRTRILATTSVENIPSQKLLDKVGFRKTGRLLSFDSENGELNKEIEYEYFL